MGSKTASETAISRLAELRLLVAALGEKADSPWWNTSFFSPAAESFHQFNFPRTAISASVASVQEAARRSHDQAVGAVGAFHLFRFSAVVEEQVHHFLLRNGSELADSIESSEAGMLRLRHLAGEPAEWTSSPGAVDCGTLSLSKKASFTPIAEAYYAAFESGDKSFPYFQISA